MNHAPTYQLDTYPWKIPRKFLFSAYPSKPPKKIFDAPQTEAALGVPKHLTDPTGYSNVDPFFEKNTQI